MVNFSVIISTLNRCDFLEETLRSLFRQNYPTSHFEIIVVDNGSSDNTKQIVTSYHDNKSISLVYFFEPELGLSKARNSGLMIAKYPWITFLDDDAIAQPDWLNNLSNAIQEDENHIIALGGKIELQWDVPKPIWFPDELEGYLSGNSFLGNEKFDFPFNKYPYGTNMVIEKNAVIRIGGFDPNYGRIGASLRTGEETVIFDLLRPLGRIVYVPDALVRHRVPPYRATKQYLLDRAFFQGIANSNLDQAHFPRSRFGLVRSTVANLYFAFRNLLKSLILLVFRKRKEAFAMLFFGITNLGRSKQNWSLVFSFMHKKSNDNFDVKSRKIYGKP